MKEIQALVSLLAELRLKRIDIICNEESNSPSTKLFDLIAAGEITTDEEAALYLYGKNEKSELFRRFKSTFKEKLINNLFFLDEQHKSLHSYQRAVLHVQKRWSAITILYQRGQSKLATQMAERLLPAAMQYELTEIVFFMLNNIKTYHATQSGDLKKYSIYKELWQEYFELLQWEIKARDMYDNIRVNYVHSEAYRPEVADQASSDYLALQPALAKKHSAELHFSANMIRIAAYVARHDYSKVMLACVESLNYFRQKPFEYRKGISIMLDLKLAVCTQLKRFEEGEVAGRQALALSHPSSVNWYLTMGNHILLALHCQRYQQAFEYYRHAVTPKGYHNISNKLEEKFKLYEAYLYLLVSSDKVPMVKIEDFPGKQKFRINKFLNEMPIFQKDKSGLNVPVMIVQILYSLKEQQHDKVIDKIKAIELYCHRHLHKDNTLYRANCFIQALIELPKAGFHRHAFVRKAEKYLQKLKDLPMERARQSYIVEIVPFEVLWEFALEYLPYTKRIKKAKQGFN